MAFAPVWTPEASETFKRLEAAARAAAENRARTKAKKSSQEEGRLEQLTKCVRLLLDDPRHPGLQTHEYHSLPHPYRKSEKVFEAYIQHRTSAAYRLFWWPAPKNLIQLV